MGFWHVLICAPYREMALLFYKQFCQTVHIKAVLGRFCMTLIRTPQTDKKGKTLYFDSVPIMAKKAGWAPGFPSPQTRKLKMGELILSPFSPCSFSLGPGPGPWNSMTYIQNGTFPFWKRPHRYTQRCTFNLLDDSIITQVDNADQQSQWYRQLQIQSSWNVCIGREQSLCLWGPLCVQRLTLSYHHCTYQPCCHLTVM